MGWLELLPLLRRVLPLLDRLAPMLETAVAGRLGGRAAAVEANAASVAELTRGSATMQAALDEQARSLTALTSQTENLHAAINRSHNQVAYQFTQLTAALRSLRMLVVTLLILVLLCLALLLVLILRHR